MGLTRSRILCRGALPFILNMEKEFCSKTERHKDIIKMIGMIKMELNETSEIVKEKMELVEYIYYLQYEMEKDDITVETEEAVFMVWEGSSFKVNGEETSSAEFYELLSPRWKQVVCNNEIFEDVGNKYVSINPIVIRKEKISSTIQL